MPTNGVLAISLHVFLRREGVFGGARDGSSPVERHLLICAVDVLLELFDHPHKRSFGYVGWWVGFQRDGILCPTLDSVDRRLGGTGLLNFCRRSD